MKALALVALVAGAGCTKTNACKGGTLFVSITLDAGARSADRLDVDISLDGGAAKHSEIAGGLPSGRGSIEVRFPGGYPRGATAQVTVSALQGGVVLAMGSVTTALRNGCEAASLALSPSVAMPDLAGHDLANAPPEDLAGADLTPLPPDLTTVSDLTQNVIFDLAGSDFANCVPAVSGENCFNNMDDDCDGLPDCADSDCNATAICVPEASGPFSLGAREAENATCAPSWGDNDLEQGDSGCDASGCSCDVSGCTYDLLNHNAQCTSGGSTVGEVGFTCTEFPGNPAAHSIGLARGDVMCAGKGVATPIAPPYQRAMTFCLNPGVAGRGCAVGNVCVPKGTKQCVMAAGHQGSCPGGYATPDYWFGGISDTRVCECHCAPLAASCAAVQVFGYTSIDCSGTPQVLTNMCQQLDVESARLGLACGPYTIETAQVTYSDERTICCIP